MIDFQQARRVFDTKPWAAHLYVTEQCNLDCHYCNEYDNSIPNPNVADLKKIPEEVKSGLDIIPVEHADEVLRKALVLKNPSKFLCLDKDEKVEIGKLAADRIRKKPAGKGGSVVPH